MKKRKIVAAKWRRKELDRQSYKMQEEKEWKMC